MACKISGKMEATTFFVVAFDMQKAKKSPARGSPRTIGQKPEPTIRRGRMHEGSLREGATR